MTSILVVDDQKALRKNLSFYLKSQGYDADCAESGEEALEKLEAGYYDIVISDYRLEKMSGHELMTRAKTYQPSLEFIIITGYGNIPLAVELIREGASDLLTKPFEYAQIIEAIQKVLKRRQRYAGREDEPHFQMVAQTQKMKDIVDLATKAAAADVTVLIQGEIGTGKELFAKVVHRQSQRYRGTLVAVECASMSESIMEKRIFGGPDDNDSGVLTEACGGIALFRDIECLSPRLQARLVRFMREGTFTPVDSAATKKSDARIMATTTRDLKNLVTSGAFREDLYYLLSVMPVYVPPLRARTSDILPLVKHFLAKNKAKADINVRAISAEVLAWMNSYEWPGNVQELENIISRACVLATGDTLDESLIFTLPQDRPEPEEAPGFLNMTLKDNQRTLILKVLKQNNGNFSRTATQLGISRTTLWRRMKKFKIEGLPVVQD